MPLHNFPALDFPPTQPSKALHIASTLKVSRYRVFRDQKIKHPTRRMYDAIKIEIHYFPKPKKHPKVISHWELHKALPRLIEVNGRSRVEKPLEIVKLNYKLGQRNFFRFSSNSSVGRQISIFTFRMPSSIVSDLKQFDNDTNPRR